MKKLGMVMLVLLCAFALFAGGSSEKKAERIYVLGPTPDHGWTAQAGAFAE